MWSWPQRLVLEGTICRRRLYCSLEAASPARTYVVVRILAWTTNAASGLYVQFPGIGSIGSGNLRGQVAVKIGRDMASTSRRPWVQHSVCCTESTMKVLAPSTHWILSSRTTCGMLGTTKNVCGTMLAVKKSGRYRLRGAVELILT